MGKVFDHLGYRGSLDEKYIIIESYKTLNPLAEHAAMENVL
jgi:hypothetical protein